MTFKMALPMRGGTVSSQNSFFRSYSSFSGQGSTDMSSTERLKAYSDAIFSIIATVMILPIAHKEIDETEDLRDVLLHTMAPVLAVYFVSFFVVTSIWGSHTWLFETVDKTDDVLIILNLGLIMASTFLPYTYTLLGFNWSEPLALLLACLATFMVFLMQAVFIFHVFRTPAVLKPEIRYSSDVKVRRNLMYLSCAVPAVLCLVPLLALPFSPLLADYLLFLMFISTYIRKLIVLLLTQTCARFRGSSTPDGGGPSNLYAQAIRPSFVKFYEDTIPKERIIAFSDGVFAIVATLVILDICEGAVPSKEDIETHGGLAGALNVYSPLFRAYAGTFITVATLWLVHHTLLEHVAELNKIMALFNTMCLSCIGLLPFGFKWTSMYTVHDNYKNELVSIQLNLCIIFLASIFQCIIFVIGLCKPSVYIYACASFGGNSHIYTAVRLLLYPLVTLFVYFLTFASFEFSAAAFQWMEIGMPVLYLILYIIFKRVKTFCLRPIQIDLTEPNDNDRWPLPVETQQYEGD